MKSKMKFVLALGMAFCFVLAVSAPMVLASGSTPTKKASTTQHASANKMHKTKAMTNAEVKTAQEALIKDGAKIKADGIMGKQTHSAIKAFQKKNGLKVNGKLDKETLAKLE
jgi:carboxyl-terminal processing protease